MISDHMITPSYSAMPKYILPFLPISLSGSQQNTNLVINTTKMQKTYLDSVTILRCSGKFYSKRK